MLDWLFSRFRRSQSPPDLRPFRLTNGGEATLALVPRQEAIATWEAECRAAAQTGRYPVLIGAVEDVAKMREYESMFDADFAATMAAAAGIDAEAWFEERFAQDREYYDVPEGDWPTGPATPTGDSLVLFPPFGRRHGEVVLARFPTAHPWEVPALLGWGGWNDCPEAAAQVALLRRWHALYGTEVLTIGWDTLELRAERPPTDREGAIALAREQFLYCSDLGPGADMTIAELAAGLLNQRLWYFWWD